MTFTDPGSGLDRLGAEEWPWVERASCGSASGREEGPATGAVEFSDGAGVGSRRGSGSGGG